VFYTPQILVFLISLVLLINHWHQNKGIVYLVIVLLGLSLRQATLYAFNTSNDTFLIAILVGHFEPLIILLGPFFIYYIKSVIKGRLVFDYGLLLLCIPSLLVLINLGPYYLKPFEDKLAYFNLPSGNRPGLSYLFLPINIQHSLLMIYTISCFGYSIWYLKRIKNDNSYLKKKSVELIRYISVIVQVNFFPHLVILFLVIITSKSFGILDFKNAELLRNDSVYYISMLLPVGFFFIPSWLYNENAPFSFIDKLMQNFKKAESANLSDIEVLDGSSDLAQILTYITTEKPYLNPHFSSHDISRTLNIPQIRVSNCFNKELGIPFPAYRNKLRIEHAIKLFRVGAQKNVSIEGIAEMSGFKSKTIFYKIFKEEYGVTPTDWIKMNDH
jgi:AraC-like DNA-binding protein